MPGLTGFAYKEKPMPNFAALLAAVLATKHGWGEEDFAALKDRYAISNCPSQAEGPAFR